MREELPKDWKWVKVGSVAALFRGINYKKDVASNIPSKENLPILRGNNINGELNFEDLVYVPQKLIKPEQLVKKDDIIFAMSSGSKHLVGKSAVAKSDFKGSYGAFCAMLRVSDDVSKPYVSYIFKGNSYRKLISEIAKGTNINNLKREHILDFEFPLPPKPIQQAIVSKIEELFSELEKGIEGLFTAKQQLKTYRQSVLKWAFEGRLSESEFTGSENEQNEIQNKKSGNPINSENPVNSKNSDSDKGELPKGWKIVKIEDATISLDNKRKPINKDERKKRVGNIPYYGANGQVGWIDDYIFDEPLICVVEDETFTGREIPFSYKITGKTWVNNHAHVLKPKDGLNIDFLNYQLFYYPFLRLTTGTTGRKKLTKNALSNAPIKICSIQEQNKIVQAIESRLNVADKMEESITQSLQQAEALKQSILKKAFEGKLA